MANLEVPSIAVQHAIAVTASNTMQRRMVFNSLTNEFNTKICAVCDTFATVLNPCHSISISDLADMCLRTNGTRQALIKYYPLHLLEQYKIPHEQLDSFVLSPASILFDDKQGTTSTFVCRICWDEWNLKRNSRGNAIPPPRRALWNGYLTGNPPDELQCLNRAELALISPNRIISHAISLRANRHDGVYGWHAIYENQVDANLASVQQLVDAGMQGELVCVLCGPFTTTQKALVRAQLTVRPDRLIAAFQWLKVHNHYFKDFTIPNIEDIPLPYIYEDETL